MITCVEVINAVSNLSFYRSMKFDLSSHLIPKCAFSIILMISFVLFHPEFAGIAAPRLSAPIPSISPWSAAKCNSSCFSEFPSPGRSARENRNRYITLNLWGLIRQGNCKNGGVIYLSWGTRAAHGFRRLRK